MTQEHKRRPTLNESVADIAARYGADVNPGAQLTRVPQGKSGLYDENRNYRGLQTKPPNMIKGQVNKERVRVGLARGMSLESIAKKHGLAFSTVQGWAHRIQQEEKARKEREDRNGAG